MTLSYGTDVKIHGSEIHMICHIKHNPGSHISGIARTIKVTRGAVSQIVMNAREKGASQEGGECGEQAKVGSGLDREGREGLYRPSKAAPGFF